MNDNPNFTSVLDKPADTIKAPPLTPIGTYLCAVEGQPSDGTAKTGTQYKEFAYKILQPTADVDADALAAIEGGVQGRILRGQTTRFYLSEAAAFMLIDHMANDLGISKEGKSGKEMLAEVPGRQVYVKVVHSPSQDGTRMFANVAGYAKV